MGAVMRLAYFRLSCQSSRCDGVDPGYHNAIASEDNPAQKDVALVAITERCF